MPRELHVLLLGATLVRGAIMISHAQPEPVPRPWCPADRYTPELSERGRVGRRRFFPSPGTIAVPYVGSDLPLGSRFPPDYNIFVVDLTRRLRFCLKRHI